MNEPDNVASQSGIVRFDIADSRTLYSAYMPFIANGGLFVGQRHLGDMRYDLGSEVFLTLNLIEHNERLPVAGRVVWLSLRDTQRPQGIGIQFAPRDGGVTQRRIETLLAGQIDSDKATDTL